MKSLKESLNDIKKIFQSNLYPYSTPLEYEHNRLSIILNDNKEYKRLCDLVDARHNTYNRQEEVCILNNLNNILLTGFSSKNINSIYDIKAANILLIL
jgi:hypothetical protein